MKDEIIEKLRILLAKGALEDEPDVVYLLTQIRKVFERDETIGKNLRTLKFYCNWALHTQLDRDKAAQEFLDEVDPVLTLDGSHDHTAHHRLNQLLTLQAFRGELSTFFTSTGLNDNFCDNDNSWFKFLAAYSRVVENCDIEVKGSARPPHGPLNLSVKSVKISATKRHYSNISAMLTYPMVWVISYSDGRAGKLTLTEIGLLGAIVEIS